MKLELKITGERTNMSRSHISDVTEPYTVAQIEAEGDSDVIAGHLRAVADSISPKQPIKRGQLTMEARG